MEKVSRQLYGWLAFSAFLGLALSLVLTVFNIDAITINDQTLFHQDTAPIRVVAFFGYFTIWSNLLVVYIGAAIALRREGAKYFADLFATGLTMISITGLVYNAVLLPAFPPTGWFWVSSTLMHLITPLLYLYLWLRKGPRGYIVFSRALQILLIPILYLGYTVLHGLFIKQWPYKFLDLTSEGVVLWLVGVAIIFGFGTALIYGFSRLDTKPIR